MNIILQTCVFILVAMAVNASERVPRAAGKNCPRDIEFPKGVSCKRCVKYRRRGTQVVLKCPKGFGRYGNKRLSCGQDNKWKGDYPVCVKSGCAPIDTTNDVNLVMSLHPKFDDAVVTFQCEDEYVLFGPTEIHCDGVQWSHAPPKCEAITDLLECDFEYGLCGWTEQQRVQANQNWTRHLGSTQTGGTGPKRDHTFPNSYTGHYLYFESSAPTIEGDTAVLASPPYTSDLSPMCFEFWYHMLGPDDQGHVGSLSVYVLNEGQQMDDKQPEYYKEGNQGDVWHKGDIFIDSQIDTYQILIKATRKKSYMSDIAIDDVRLYNCTQSTTTTTITTTTTTSTTPTTPTTVSVPSTRTSITTTSSTSLSADGSNLTSAIVSLSSSTAIPQSTTNSSKIQQSTILETSTTPSINKTVITEGSTMSSTKQAINNIVTTVMTPSTTSNMVMSSSKSGIVSTTPAVSVTPSGATSTVALTLETTKLASSSPTGKTMTQGITTRRTSVKSSTSTTELLTTKPADLTTMTKSKTPTIVKQTTKPLTSQAASKLQTATVTLESSSLKVETTSPVPVTKSTTSERTKTPRRTTTAATTPFSLFATKTSKYNTRPSSLSPGPVSSQARSSTQTSTTSSSTKSTTKISPPQTSSSHSATTVFGSSVSPRSSSVIATVKSGNSTAGVSSQSKAMTSKLPLSTSKDDKGGKSNITANPARSTHPEDETLKPLMIGLGVGIIVGLIIIGVIGWVCMRRRKFYTSRYEDELKPITNAASTQSLNNVDYYQDDFDIENV